MHTNIPKEREVSFCWVVLCNSFSFSKGQFLTCTFQEVRIPSWVGEGWRAGNPAMSRECRERVAYSHASYIRAEEGCNGLHSKVWIRE